MGLLDLDENTRQGLLGLGVGMMQPTRDGRLGSALANGFNGFQESQQQGLENSFKKFQLEQMRRQQKITQTEQERANQLYQRQQQLLSSALPRIQAKMEAGQTLSPEDIQPLAVAGFPGAKELIDLHKERTKFKTENQAVRGPDGVVSIRRYDDAGGFIADKVAPAEKLHTVDLGGTVTTFDPISGKTVGGGMSKTLSPEDNAQLSIERQKLAQDGRQFQQQMAFKERTLGGATPAGTKLTEEQGKATVQLAEAENAMRTIDELMAKNKNIAKGNLFLNTFAPDKIANVFMTEDEGRFNNAWKTIAMASIRTASGQGMSDKEAEREIALRMPRFGDQEKEIRQKLNALKVYLSALSIKSGPGSRMLDAKAQAGRTAPKMMGKNSDLDLVKMYE